VNCGFKTVLFAYFSHDFGLFLRTCEYGTVSVTELQYSRTVEVGRDLWRSSCPTLLPK